MGSKVNKKGDGRETLGRPILISTILHVIIFTLIITASSGSLISPKPPLDVVWVELPKGTGEDITTVGSITELPKTTPQDEIKPIPPLPEEQSEKALPEPKVEAEKAPPEPKVVSDKAMPEPKVGKESKKEVKKGPRTSRMSDALAKIDKRLKERGSDPTSQGAKGVEYGTSDKPVKDANYQSALLTYRAAIRAKILSRWNPPGEGGSAQVVVTVFISKSGTVISKRLSKSSGSDSLNQSAMRAIDRASPFPIPPEPLKWEAYSEGFSVVFNPRKR